MNKEFTQLSTVYDDIQVSRSHRSLSNVILSTCSQNFSYIIKLTLLILSSIIMSFLIVLYIKKYALLKIEKRLLLIVKFDCHNLSNQRENLLYKKKLHDYQITSVDLHIKEVNQSINELKAHNSIIEGNIQYHKTKRIKLTHQLYSISSQIKEYSKKTQHRNEINDLLKTIRIVKMNIFILSKDRDMNKMKNNIPFDQSNILTSQEEINQIKEWIKEKGVIEMELIYQMSRDGRSSHIFHKKSYQINYTLVLMKIDNGVIIGGYTEESWDGYGFKKDTNALLFNLTNKKVYKVIDDNKAIYGFNEVIVVFGFGDLFMDDKSLYSRFPLNYGYQAQRNELTNGKEIFDLFEMEVYRIKFKTIKLD